jgi:FkbM family methyltransferase
MMFKLQDMMWKRLHEKANSVGRNKNEAFKDLFQSLIAKIDAKLILEVGAHEAEFSSQVAKNMPNSKVLAYEANPFVYKKFKNKLPANVEYLNLAVGVDNNPKKFFIPRFIPTQNEGIEIGVTNTTSSLRSRSNESVLQDEVVCECTTIDLIMLDNNWMSPCAIWIDVEGAVGDVLFGANKSLKRNVALIYVEQELRSIWDGQWLASEIEEYLFSKNFIPVVRDCETIWQFNQIYINNNYLNNDIIGLIQGYLDHLIDKIAANS